MNVVRTTLPNVWKAFMEIIFIYKFPRGCVFLFWSGNAQYLMFVVRGNKREYMSIKQTVKHMRNRAKYEEKAKCALYMQGKP